MNTKISKEAALNFLTPMKVPFNLEIIITEFWIKRSFKIILFSHFQFYSFANHPHEFCHICIPLVLSFPLKINLFF